jgi:uncharacterized tellurite resistance protein B-like protein
MSILKFLGLQTDPSPTEEGDTALRLQEALEHLEPAKARYITSFALILGRVAGADDAISEKELQEIDRIIRVEGGLDDKQASLVLELTRNRDVLGQAVDSLVTGQFGRVASREQKTQLLNCLFSVAAAEGNVSEVEEDMIHMISGEINLPERDFIGVRYRYLKYLPAKSKSTFR